jgi:hypothetical protein
VYSLYKAFFLFWWYEILAQMKVDYSVIKPVCFALWVPPPFLPERKHYAPVTHHFVYNHVYSWKEKQIFAWHMFLFVILSSFHSFIKCILQWKIKYSKSNTSVVKRPFYTPCVFFEFKHFTPQPNARKNNSGFYTFQDSADGGGGTGTNSPGQAAQKGAQGPTMLHKFLSSWVVWLFVNCTH